MIILGEDPNGETDKPLWEYLETENSMWSKQ